MQIIEQSITPKAPNANSEDGIVVSDDFIAVIDGSTSKSTRRCFKGFNIAGRSNGEIAMRIVSNYIRKMPKTTTCHQFCMGVSRAVSRHYKPALLPHLSEHPEDRLSASAIVFSRLNREIWMIGDCQCIVGNEYFDNPKPYEQELAHQRAAIIRQSPQPWDHFLTNDTARQAIIPHMLLAMQQQNISYSVIDGFPVAMRHVRIINLSLHPWQLVLASDGYPFLCPTLEESEARLFRQREDDPLNIGPLFMATKAFAQGNNSFDDRAYIRFNV